MEINDIVERFKTKPYMVDMGKGKLSKWLNCSKDEIIAARYIYKTYHKPDENIKYEYSDTTERRILAIGDTHIPAEHKDALETLKEAYIKYDITDVIHIGDLTDFQALSFHSHDADLPSAGDEINIAIEKLKPWYEAFPNMTIVASNHGDLPMRKMFDAGIPTRFIRNLEEILGVPNWKFVQNVTINNMFFTHGLGGTARSRARALGMSVIQGHYHAQRYVEYIDHNHKTFAMQVGCMVDKDALNMAYAKHSVLAMGYGVILDADSDNPIPISLTIKE